MSDFPQVVKYLDYLPSRAITKDEADLFDQHGSPLSKYQRIQKTRPIKKLEKTIILKGYEQNALINPIFPAELLFQYNLTFSHFFVSFLTIPDTPEGPAVAGGVLTVKYRVGTTVYRYALAGDQVGGILNLNFTTFPGYSGQVIKNNCVFEFWTTFHANSHPIVGLRADITIGTGRLINPADADQQEVVALIINPIGRNTIGRPMPENLPLAQPEQAWLDNV